MNKRFISLWFRHLMTDWLTLRRPELKDIPCIVVAATRGRIIITSTNPLAEAQGIVSGMVAADAKAMVPGIEVINEIPGQAEKLLKALGEWCIRYSPAVAIDTPEGLLLNISGCAHLWGGEYEYLKEIVTRLRNKGYDVRGAIADTAGAAWAIARFAKKHPIIANGKQAEALLSLPPTALRLEAIILERLHKLGFYTINHFIGMARQPLRRRFGEELLSRLDQALGNKEELLNLIQPIEPFTERLPCLEPIKTATGIEIALKTLLEKLCHRMINEGKGLRAALLKCYRVDGQIITINIGTNRASHNVSHLFRLFDGKISSIAPALGIELFVLEAPKVEDTEPDQEVLWTAEISNLKDIELVELLDRVANKIGSANIHRYLPQERHWPEQSIRRASSLSEKPQTHWRKNRPRPPLLLPKPERIEVTALLPDNPPMLFIYKGKRHIVAKVDDAERIECEWWLQAHPRRDYYVVEDQDGQRYWLFRSGDYSDAHSQWYIHGFFA